MGSPSVLDALGGRKFLLSLIILAVGTVAQIKSANGINNEFVALLVGVLTAFSATNAFVTHKSLQAAGASEGQAAEEGPAAQPPMAPEVDLSPIHNDIAALRDHQEALAGAITQTQQAVALAQKAAQAALSVSSR